MSEDNNNLPVPLQGNDFKERDIADIQRYMEAGLPGILRVDEDKMKVMLDLYMNGKSYRKIARDTQTEKAIVLFLSYKYNWFAVKQEHYNEIEESIKNKLEQNKLDSQTFISNLLHHYHKKIGDKIDRYMVTGNEQ